MGLTRSDVLREEGRGLHPRRWLTQQQETRINSQIRAREVRLISHEGEQVGVVSIDEARRMAQDVDLDLVEVAPMAKPPVCKLMDYGKFKYEQQKAQRKGRKKSHTAELKRLRMRPKIDRHDIDTKLRKARQFLAEGDKVQVHMRFRGREMAHIEIGQQRLLEFAKELAEIAKVERAPSREGREMTMMLTPRSNAAEVYAAYKEALRNAKAGKKGKSPVTEPEEEPEDEDLLDDDEEQDLDDDEEQGLDDDEEQGLDDDEEEEQGLDDEEQGLQEEDDPESSENKTS